MKTKAKNIDISSFAPLFLFACFSICVMSVLLIGADLYRKQAERDVTGYQKRTVSQYITTRIHQSDSYNACFVGDFETRSPQSTGNTFFFTELFASADASLDLSAGEPLLRVESVNFVDNGRNIIAMITHIDGSRQKIVVNLRCSGEKLS